MTWFEKYEDQRLPELTVSVDNKVYLKRWWIIPRNRFFNVYLHKFEHSDEPVLHDHPWPSLSFVLKGQMTETFLNGGRLCQQGQLFFRRATTLHYLTLIDDKPAWTLFITGPTLREWGFWVESRWVSCFQHTNRPGVEETRNYSRRRNY